MNLLFKTLDLVLVLALDGLASLLELLEHVLVVESQINSQDLHSGILAEEVHVLPQPLHEECPSRP